MMSTFLCCMYVRSNLFVLGLLLLIAGFSSPGWQGYSVYTYDNETFTGHQGLWHKYLYNDSIACHGDVGSDIEDHGMIDKLHEVRNLLAVSIGFYVLILVICSIKVYLAGENDGDGRCETYANTTQQTQCCMLIVMLTSLMITFGLSVAAIVIYQQNMYAYTKNIQDGTQYHSGSYVIIIISLVPMAVTILFSPCDTNILDITKTFLKLILSGLVYVTRKLFETVQEDRLRYVALWVLHLVVLTCLSVGLFSTSWFIIPSTQNNNVSVTMGMWWQCRELYSLTCCSSVYNFYTDTPGWFYTCRDVTMIAYVLFLLAVIFSAILIYIPGFRVPLLLVHIGSGVTMVASCVLYGINVTKEEDVHSRFGAAFIINVVVTTLILFFILEFPISAAACNQDPFDDETTRPLIRRSYHQISGDDEVTFGETIRIKFLSLKERLSLLLIHRKSRRNAQIPVNDDTDETVPEHYDLTFGETIRIKFLSLKERLSLLLIHRKSRMKAQIPVNDDTDETYCTVCMENPVDTKILPCSHTCCRACLPSLEYCHICTKPIKGNMDL